MGTLSHETNEFATALGIGTGLVFVSLLGMQTEPQLLSPVQPRSRPEEVVISFTGHAELLLAEARTSEYSTCSPELAGGISRCHVHVPDRTERLTIVIKPTATFNCTSVHPLVTIGTTVLTSPLLQIESHSNRSYCVYQVVRPSTKKDDS